MARRPTFKPSFRDHIGEVNRALAGQEAMFGDLRRAKGMPEPAPIILGPKRVIQHRSEKEELEGSVLKEVGKVIALSPNVVMAWRQNGGAAQAADGVFRIWFYRWVKAPVKEIVLVDFVGVLKSGFMFAIECKRRDWHYAASDREIAQANFMGQVKARGGKAGFVTCAEQAQAILK